MVDKKKIEGFVEVYENLVKEVEENYVQTMHDSVLEYVIRPPEDYVKTYKIPSKLPL